MILRKSTRKDYKFIHDIYMEAFPKEERMPYWLLKWTTLHGDSDMWIAEEAGGAKVSASTDCADTAVDTQRSFGAKSETVSSPVGFMWVVTYQDMAYLFYFAVADGCRGSGYGSKILQEVLKKYDGYRIFLAREQLDASADNYSQRLRRHEFYLRNGLSDLPMQIKEGPVVYDTMGVGGPVSPAEYRVLIEHWAGKFITSKIGMKILDQSRD